MHVGRASVISRPWGSVAAAPLTPAILGRISLTPTARLALVARLLGAKGVPSARVTPPKAHSYQRTLGQSLLLDRLLTGVTIGTTLDVSSRETDQLATAGEIGARFDALA